jgi:hypothetical protein
MAEAAYISGAAYLIGAYYTKSEYLTRFVFFSTAGIIAGAVNGFLSTLIAKMNGTGGYAAWRWLVPLPCHLHVTSNICSSTSGSFRLLKKRTTNVRSRIFIIEGIVTLCVSVGSWWLMPPFPEHSTFLSSSDKTLLLARVKADGGHIADEDITVKQVLHHLSDWKIWAAVAMNMGVTENANSIANFQPTILKGLGYTSIQAQVHTIPVYIVGAAFSVIFAYMSEWLNHRYLFYMLGWLVLSIGLIIQIAYPPAANIRYMAMFFMASGAYLAMPVSIVWVSINAGKGYKRAIAIGAIINFGTAGAFVSSNVFLFKETPRFHTGFSTGLGLACMGALAATVTFFGVQWENKRRDARRLELPEVLDIDMKDGMSDEHPDFRFVL